MLALVGRSGGSWFVASGLAERDQRRPVDERSELLGQVEVGCCNWRWQRFSETLSRRQVDDDIALVEGCGVEVEVTYREGIGDVDITVAGDDESFVRGGWVCAGVSE